MLLFGRSRSRRGLASALIGEIAAVIDGMEGFEEVRKLEDMEIGAAEHLDELGAFTLPKFSVYESNADRLDLFDAAIQRQIAYFFTCAGSLAGHDSRPRGRGHRCRDRERRHEPGDDAAPVARRKPIGEEEDDAGKETGLGDAQEAAHDGEAGGAEL